ncbi:hypothetical protein PIB30_016324 [Stylosanthes scabra]|uniref:Reverse transcriptase domain-containing protein n=1 Tax=Stylosanthes scabra TaxID=79078 RepID=A0ABU6R7K1_9FABA|nr:hypothetical protein [Stylosanthes scabra]
MAGLGLDIEKAYDHVDWRFLWHSLCGFGFPSRTRLGCIVSHLVENGDWLLVAMAREIFMKASGLKVNLLKSKAKCSKNVYRWKREFLAGVSAIPLTQNLGRYLGVTIGNDRAARKTVQDVFDKIWKKLSL